MNDVIVEFENIINIFPKQISEINNNRFTLKLENKWSENEILGHLIDSAIINYLRIIKAQFEDNPQLFYNQNNYVKYANYNNSDIVQLINLWVSLNTQILFLFQQVVDKKVIDRNCNNVSLEFLIVDYVKHLKHHINQILL
ncbi:MAG: hypothetical protein RR578_04155 [Bacilli bacterium]|uniref:hypothetical protein n=1 Tax=Algoriella sp. TaxID=1872434 RepID=UPI002FCB8714